jgi:Phospholipase_D-nuclease N-terminal
MTTGTNPIASVPWAAIAPIAVLAVGFAAYCVFDLLRSEVRYLPKWAWAVVCVVSIPVGGIVYLLVGRVHR